MAYNGYGQPPYGRKSSLNVIDIAGANLLPPQTLLLRTANIPLRTRATILLLREATSKVLLRVLPRATTSSRPTSSRPTATRLLPRPVIRAPTAISLLLSMEDTALLLPKLTTEVTLLFLLAALTVLLRLASTERLRRSIRDHPRHHLLATSPSKSTGMARLMPMVFVLP